MAKSVEIILKILQTGAEATVTLMDAMLVGHASSPRPYYKMTGEPIRFKKDWAEIYKHKQSFYSLVNQLKRDGLIEKNVIRKNTFWSITSVGKKHLAKMNLRLFRRMKDAENEPKLPKKKYIIQSQKNLIIVSFDVPEYARRRRNWLRACLISFGFEKLQKSVWMGKLGLPKDFIQDLEKLEMLPWVHIFSVSGRGTIKEIPAK